MLANACICICITQSNEIMCVQVQVLTFLYAWGDGQHGDDEAQAAVDAQEDLVK